MDDQTAISRLKQGDISALEALVRRYQVQAVHAAYAIVYDRALAEDVAQTAFVKAVEKIRLFDERYPFAPWFFRIVVNDAIKAVRKQNTTVPWDQDSGESTKRLAEWLIDPDPRPEQALERREMRQNILQALQTLAPEQRAVIVMRYFLEMSEAEMVMRMDRPLSTIKWWLREARRRLRSRIDSSRMEEGS